MNGRDREQLEADCRYWQELADLLGWRLHGFTFRSHASFETGHRDDSLANITGAQRDDIMKAVSR